MRIRREENVNLTRELDNELVREISRDPLMKYSAVMSGLFHKRVIICEGDSDCMFYSSLLETVHGKSLTPSPFLIHGEKTRWPADSDYDGWAAPEVAEALDVALGTVYRIKLRFTEEVDGKLMGPAPGQPIGSWRPAPRRSPPSSTALSEPRPCACWLRWWNWGWRPHPVAEAGVVLSPR